MTNWKETTLGEVVDIIIDHRGMTPKKMGGDWASVGYRAVSAKSIKTGQLVNEDQMNLLPENLYRKWMKEEVEYGDILLTSEAPLGEHIIWKSEEKLVLSQRIFGIRTEKEVFDPFFFNYFIDSKYYQHQLKSRESGSTVTGIKQSELLKTKILLPPLSEQKEIAGVLSSLDDKIELLREENKTLEATAQAIFKEWFVNFNFPGATGKMIDSELGKIPEWWGVGKIKDLINIFSGFAFSSSDFIQNGKYRLVTIKNVQDRYFVQDIKDTFDDLPLKMPQYCHLKTGDILLSLTGNVGRICLVVGENYLLNQRVAKLEAINGKDYAFTYLLFLQESIFSLLQNTASGTAQQNLSPVQTKEIEIVMPARFVLDTFGDIGNPMIKKVNQNNFQIQTLSTFRDTLLPKLMSGDLRIK